MVKKIPKSLAKDFDTFVSKVETISKKSPLKVRYMTKVRVGDDEVVLKVNDDLEVSFRFYLDVNNSILFIAVHTIPYKKREQKRVRPRITTENLGNVHITLVQPGHADQSATQGSLGICDGS